MTNFMQHNKEFCCIFFCSDGINRIIVLISKFNHTKTKILYKTEDRDPVPVAASGRKRSAVSAFDIHCESFFIGDCREVFRMVYFLVYQDDIWGKYAQKPLLRKKIHRMPLDIWPGGGCPQKQLLRKKIAGYR